MHLNKIISSEYEIIKGEESLEILLKHQNPKLEDVEIHYIDALSGFRLKPLKGRVPFLGAAMLTYHDNVLVRIYFEGTESLFQQVNRQKKDGKVIEATLAQKIQYMDKAAKDK